MARELILVPKFKYEQLIKRKRDGVSETETSIGKQESVAVKNVDKPDDEKKKVEKSDESYVKMKPTKFLTSKNKSKINAKKSIKEKWLTFNV